MVNIKPHTIDIRIPYDGRCNFTGVIKCWEHLNKGDEIRVEYYDYDEKFMLYGKITDYDKSTDTYYVTGNPKAIYVKD